jgi:hypothetical protein
MAIAKYAVCISIKKLHVHVSIAINILNIGTCTYIVVNATENGFELNQITLRLKAAHIVYVYNIVYPNKT